jgi:Mg-chelatase subunit ChlD
MFIQAAVGFAPVTLLFVLLSLFAKKRRARNIFAAVLCAAVPIAGLVIGIPQIMKESAAASVTADNLRFAYALIDDGALDTAHEVIKADKTNGGYSLDDTQALARIAALGGKIQTAKALYNKVGASDEQAAVLTLPNGYIADTDEYKNAASLIGKAVKSYLRGFSGDDTDNYAKAAKSAAYAETSYSDYLENGSVDAAEGSRALKRLTTAYGETPELLAVAPLRVSRLKLQLLSEDFKGIAGSVDEYADYNELLIVSELYMNGYVNPSNFSEDWRGGDLSDYRAVSDALNNVYNNSYANKPREERNAAKAQIKALNAFIKNPSLVKVENALADYAESEFSYDKSKVYLQLAKTENYMGNEPKSIEYLDKSLNTVGDCDDADYTVPMYEIIGIIADKDSPERLKDVAVYTDKILTNSMTVQMTSELREPIAAAPDAETETATSFNEPFNSYVSQKRMAVNITGVDISDFDTVKANVSISGDIALTATEIKELLRVSDCDIDIENFTLDKITYTKANILLCVDVSGSMQGQPIEDLRNAVRLFVESTDAIESVALVAFNSGIVNVWTFGTPNDELVSAANSLRADGGTNMYGALVDSLGYFTSNMDEINCAILLSDGEDNDPATMTEISENIGQPFRAKGVTLYSLGFGSGAAGDYLNALAGSTGGQYAYADSSAQIQGMFDKIRAQTLNSYRLTFKAEDTLQVARNLRVAVDGESYVYDEYWYSLDGSDVTSGGNADSAVFADGKAIYGFEEKLVFKSERSRQLSFRGEGFADTDKFTISLDGNIDYDHLAWEYKDATTLSVTLPAGVGCDVYNVKVSVNGKKTVLTEGLTVAAQGSEKETRFGDYVFTSYFKYSENGVTRLSSAVMMNGWLRFKGDVTLAGDLNGQSITMTADKQSYVHYYTDTAEGIATMFATKGADVALPAFGSMTLWHQYLFNSGDKEKPNGELRVEPKLVMPIVLTEILRLPSPSVSLYPDRAAFNASEFTTSFPGQRQILKAVGLFNFETTLIGSVGAKSINLQAGVKYESGNKKGVLNPANFGNFPIFVGTDEFEIELDTYKNKFYIKYVAVVPSLNSSDSLGASLEWKWGNKEHPGFICDEVKLYADFDINANVGGVPITFHDFMVGIKGMSEPNPLKWTLMGGMDVSAVKVDAMLPGIKKWIGDVSVLKADDAELNLRMWEPYVKASTTFKMFEYVDLGSVVIEMGKFEYTNKLLGLSDEGVWGLRAKFTNGIAWHLDNCDIALQGSSELALVTRFCGVTVTGNADLDVHWWIFTPEFHAQGQAVAGVQFTHDDDTIFLAKASGGTNVFYIQWSKRRGADYGKKSL